MPKKTTAKAKDNKKDVYIYYSGPCRQTGEALVEQLGVSGGDKAPKAGEYPIIIGYGAKTSKDTNLGKATILNHPNFIRVNRNKLAALQLMKEGNVNVAPFETAENIMRALDDKKSQINLPVIGRRKYHQGGKGFYTCMTKGMVTRATTGENGAQYFQNFIDIDEEYRIHVFEGGVIHAQKKVKRTDMGEAFTEQHTDKINQTAEKAGRKLDGDTVKYVLEQTGKRVLERPDEIIRSNTRGWKFSVLNKSKLAKALVDISVTAVAAIGLDFGAVDVCRDHDGNYYVLEVNTGPGLKESSLEAYVGAFKKKIEALLAPAPVEEKVTAKTTAAQTVNATAVQTRTDGSDIKKAALDRLAVIQALISNADDDDVPGIERAAARLFR